MQLQLCFKLLELITCPILDDGSGDCSNSDEISSNSSTSVTSGMSRRLVQLVLSAKGQGFGSDQVLETDPNSVYGSKCSKKKIK